MAAEAKYAHGHHDSVLRSHRWRTATNSCAYLLPHIQPHMKILDIGCGPGNITCDLAALVPHGSVTAIDAAPAVVAEAQALAASRGTTNVVFATGNVYQLDFADGEFDIVHAHQVLQHLGDPAAALREMARVAKKGGAGIVAVRDMSHFLHWPIQPALKEYRRLYWAMSEQLGTKPGIGCHFAKYARLAGFSQKEINIGAGTWCFTGDELRWWCDMWADRVLQSDFHDNCIAQKLATEQDLQRISKAFIDFHSTVDAWYTVVNGEMLIRPA